MILYVENPKDATKKSVGANKWIWPSSRIQKSTHKSLFLYTDNEQSEKELTKMIPFTIASKRTKYLGINKGNEIYNESYKTLLKLIKDDINNWQHPTFTD